MPRFIDHSFIFTTILLTVYSQLVMRWQVESAGPLPLDAHGKLGYIFHLLLSPWVISGIVATFFSGISWMLAMTKFELSYAYPFISLNYILVLALGFVLFGETLSPTKLIGSALVILGIVVISKG